MPIKTKQSENKKIPKLRFSGFCGEWEEKRLGELGEFLGGGTPSKKISKYWDGDTAWVSSSDISEKNFTPNITRFITKEAIEKSATKIIPKNSLLIVSRVGVGKFAISNIDLCTSQDFTNFLPNKNIDIIFSAFLLKSKTKKLLSFNQGTSIKGFTKSDLENLKINFPQRQEQQKIAEFLGMVDEWIENLRAQKESLEFYKKGIMQKIFSQEIRFKDDEGNDFAEWGEKKLGEVCEIKKGKQLNRIELSTSEGHPVINGGMEPSGYTDAWNTKRNIIVISEGENSCGFVNFIKENFWCGGHCYSLLKLNSDLDLQFLYQYLKFSEKKIMRLRVGSGLPNIQKKDIEKLKIVFPSFLEQQKIVGFLTSIDNLINSKQQQITQAEEWKKGLMQRLFV